MAKKKIAKTLQEILTDTRAKVIMNRGKPVDWDYFMKLWEPDLYSRKPGKAYDVDGDYMGTDLDLHTFISALVTRGAMINIPEYKSMRETTQKEGQMVVSKDNRHGKCVGLSSNKDVFSFGIKIFDQNVMTTDSSGDFRVYNLLDILGEWHKGWKTIQFLPDQKENDFIEKWALANQDKITFDFFISKWRKHSIYSAAYFLTKMALLRLDDEARYLAGMIKVMLTAGVTYPEAVTKIWPKQTSVGDVKKVVVKSITYKTDIPPIKGAYPEIEMTQENLIAITEKRKWLVYTVKPILQYAIRGNEYANFKYTGEGNEFPHWIQNAKWEQDYKAPPTFTVNPNFINKFKGNDKAIQILTLMNSRSYKENELPQFFEEYERFNLLFNSLNEIPDEVKTKVRCTKGKTLYERLIMFQGGVGEYGVSLLRKTFDKTEAVNKDYE